MKLGQRDIQLEGAINFRDLGGYETVDGRKVKWGLFFRSAELSRLSEQDLKVLSEIGIKTILDYRTAGEIEKQPNIEIPNASSIHISVFDSDPDLDKSADMNEFLKTAASASLESLRELADFEKTYPKMAIGNTAYKKLVELISNEENLPLIQHCTAGKDRTGVGAALLLLLLGVPEKTIIEDYMLTNSRIKPLQDYFQTQMSSLSENVEMAAFFQEVLGASERFISAMFRRIKERYGSFDNYFFVEYGIDADKRESIKNLYLY
ncbi:MAG: tyrosine-protein phosphatase [Bacillota bacterium]